MGIVLRGGRYTVRRKEGCKVGTRVLLSVAKKDIQRPRILKSLHLKTSSGTLGVQKVQPLPGMGFKFRNVIPDRKSLRENNPSGSR